MVEAFDDGQSADAAMSDDLERENSRLRAQEDNELASYRTGRVHRTGGRHDGQVARTRQEARELPGVSADSRRSGTT